MHKQIDPQEKYTTDTPSYWEFEGRGGGGGGGGGVLTFTYLCR